MALEALVSWTLNTQNVKHNLKIAPDILVFQIKKVS